MLSEEAERASPTLHIDYRAEALSIQVDDCSRDLTEWLNIAKGIKKERAGKKKTILMQFFNSFLTAISKSSKVSSREKLRRHQENIKYNAVHIWQVSIWRSTSIALNDGHRHINLANCVALHSVDETVRKISQKMSDNAEELSKQVSSLSSSVSGPAGSLQAQNSSMLDKPDLVTDLLQQVLSSTPSQKNSISKSYQRKS